MGFRLTAVATVAWLAGCGPAVDPATLPDVPTVNTQRYQPGVRAQLDQALAEFESAPTSARRNAELGMLFRVYRDFNAAEALLARATALAPRNPDWLYYYGEVLEQQGKNEAALDIFARLLERERNDIASRLHLSRMQLNAGRVDDALATASPVLESHPQVGDAHVLVAQCLSRSGRTDQAIAAWETALAQLGSFKNGHYALAQLYRRVGRRDDAERQLWLFEMTHQEAPPIYDPRMVELFKLNVSDRALVRAAQAAKARGETDEALALLESAIERNPDNLETRASLVSGYAAESRFADARRHAEAGLALDDNHVELGLAAARLALSEGRSGVALARLKSITERSPKHALVRAWLGRVHEVRGRKEAAGTHYAEAIAIDPSEATARRFYIQWLGSNASPETAVRALEALVITPSRDAPLAYLALAEGHLKLGDRAAALSALDAGIERAGWLGQAALARRLSNQRARLAVGAGS